MKYKFLLFDLDGTLVDTTEGVLKSARSALLHFGILVETENLMNFFGPPLKYSFSALYGLSESDSDEAIKREIEEELNLKLDFKLISIEENILKANKFQMFYYIQRKASMI